MSTNPSGAAAAGGYNACLAAIQAAGQNRITREDAERMLDRLASRHEELKGTADVLALDRELMREARETADFERREALRRQKVEAIAAIKHGVATELVDRFVAGGLTRPQALMALMHGTEAPIAGTRYSAYAHVQAYGRRYLGGLMAAIAQDRPHLELRLKDEAFSDRVTREMEEIRDKDGKPGITGDADAEWLARLFHQYGERARRDVNRLGADVPRRQGWTPHAHDPHRIVLAGESEWIDFTLPLLDIERTFGRGASEAGVRAAMSEIWRTLITGRDRRLRADTNPDDPRDIAGLLHQARELHFQRGRWGDYNRRFGYGTVAASMFRYLRETARVAGVMEVFGPNPETMLARLSGDLELAARSDRALPGDRASDQIGQLRDIRDWGATRVMLGDADGTPGGAGGRALATVGGVARNVQILAKLGSMIAAQIPDPVLVAHAQRFRGEGFAKAWKRTFRDYLRGRGDGELRHRTFLLGEGFSGLIDHLVSPYAAEDTPRGRLSGLAHTMLRWQGAVAFTDIGRAVAARTLAAELGAHSQTDWAGLPADFRHVLELNNLTAEKWDALRTAAGTAPDGTRYLSPEHVGQVSDEALDFIIQDELAAVDTVANAAAEVLGAGRPLDGWAIPGAKRPDMTGFPAVEVMMPAWSPSLTRHPDYEAAKAGDHEAAGRIVAAVFEGRFSEQLQRAIKRAGQASPSASAGRERPVGRGRPILVAVKDAGGGGNQIPQAFAEQLARRLGQGQVELDAGIGKTNRTAHTDATAAERVARRSEFSGPVQAGRTYILVDDRVTLGGTLADLAAYIEANGGKVAFATAIAGQPVSRELGLRPEDLAALRAKHGSVEGWFRDRFGYGFEGLTRPELNQLMRHGGPAALQKAISLGRILPDLETVAPGAAARSAAAR